MNINAPHRRWLALRLLALIVAAPAAHAAREADMARYTFDVFYDGKRIGEHAFEISQTDHEIEVRSSAAFTVRLLFVPVYKYRHDATEVWRAGCLRSLNATTNDNGTRFAVTAQARPDALMLRKSARTEKHTTVDDTCPATYAYWDLDLLARERLINSQTGTVEAARLVDQGMDAIDGVAARRYTLATQDGVDIQLWYREADDRWIALETERAGGTLRYRLSS